MLREWWISWTCRATMHRPHTSPPTQVLSTKDLPWNERDCKRKIHNESMHEEPRGFTAFSSGDSSMRLSWARTIARVARPPVLTTCSLIVDAVRGTNVSAARFWLRDMSQLLNIAARASSIVRYFVGIAPFKCHDSHTTLFRFMLDHGVRRSLRAAMTYCDFIKTSSLSFLARDISRKRMCVNACTLYESHYFCHAQQL